MWEKYKGVLNAKEMIYKLITVIVVISLALLVFEVMTNDKDGRQQIVDEDGGTEASLSMILSDIKGVGDVDVMITYGDKDAVTGVIVTAKGAGSPVVKRELTNAVSAIFNIPVSNVMVFEKENGGTSNE
ncbi:hypothetical protein [Clostridium aminobutyricum]|uniref:Stage III sporulation protein AG n=1 Tax=Clostridium aminobutyricum TaxID=33953 RepID=A0A939IIG4_CLOAM|nr:hypothetical protein [Clostridium aminobutyricum]MBN7772528.1 hypothetical protein [Clostridium aminobutyricum]